jgi:DNA repair exonuclease SbcCD ATPase subunit
MIAMDVEKKDLGSHLDEFTAHKFLEKHGETMTALELRNKLRTIDINNDKKMALLEYLLNRYDEKVEVLMERPQDTNDELEKAKAALEEVMKEIEKIEAHKADLEKTGAAGGVKGNAAKQELFKLLNEDPLELNKMVVSAEAAVRKAKKMENNVCMGAVWWLERELDEAKRYKPKGGMKAYN